MFVYSYNYIILYTYSFIWNFVFILPDGNVYTIASSETSPREFLKSTRSLITFALLAKPQNLYENL